MSESLQLPDRRHELFGRDVVLKRLVARVGHKGVTFVVGRPKIGKTWLLQELGRYLALDLKYLVGYHECKGETPDLLLRALADLYARSLGESSFRDQARVLFKKHGIPKVAGLGRVFGRIVEAIGAFTGPESAALGREVKRAFDWLAQADENLRSSGLQLPRLTYDQALEFGHLAARLSDGASLVLVLDAWDRSPAPRWEFELLRSYLENLEVWPQSHVFVGIRHPSREGAEPAESPYSFAEDLRQASPEVLVLELERMELDSPDEVRRLLHYLHGQLPVTRKIADREILSLIDGFPGVLGRWAAESLRSSLQELDDLKTVAADAQAYRYREFDDLLPKLSPKERAIAVRLALLFPADDSTWAVVGDVVRSPEDDSVLSELLIAGVLEGSSVAPSFGHETRHRAALDWFTSRGEYSSLLAGEADRLAIAFAERVTSVDGNDLPFGRALAWLGRSPVSDSMSPEARQLAAAAQYLILTEHGRRPDLRKAFRAVVKHRVRATALLSRVFLQSASDLSVEGELDAALKDTELALKLPNLEAGDRAFCLYLRACFRLSRGDVTEAGEDLAESLEIRGATGAMRPAALLMRASVEAMQGEPLNALKTLDEVLAQRTDGGHYRLPALLNRAQIRLGQGDDGGALEDLCRVLESTEAPQHVKNWALFQRAMYYTDSGQVELAVADWDALGALEQIPDWMAVHALIGRERAHLAGGKPGLAAEMLSDVLSGSTLSPDDRSLGLVLRARALRDLGDGDGAARDLQEARTARASLPVLRARASIALAADAVQEGRGREARELLNGALRELRGPVEKVAMRPVGSQFARKTVKSSPRYSHFFSYQSYGDVEQLRVESYFLRAEAHRLLGDSPNARRDLDNVLARPNVSASQRGRGLLRRGVLRKSVDDLEGAAADFNAVMEVSGAAEEDVSEALIERGCLSAWEGRNDRALRDFDEAIGRPSTSGNLLAVAYRNRAIQMAKQDRWRDAISDLDAALDLEGLSPELRASLHFQRGVIQDQFGTGSASRDYSAAIAAEGAPAELRAFALLKRAQIRQQFEDIEGCLEDLSAVIEMRETGEGFDTSGLGLSFGSLARQRKGIPLDGLGGGETPPEEWSGSPLEGAKWEALLSRIDILVGRGDFEGVARDLHAAERLSPGKAARKELKRLIRHVEERRDRS